MSNTIREQKWSVILEILQLTCHNSEIDQRIEKMKITRCPDKCGKQWRLKQRNPGWQKQKEERKKKRKEKIKKRKNRRNQKKTKKGENDESEKGGRKIEDLG